MPSTSRYLPYRIISGGQTGADQGALEAAQLLGIRTGGWIPRGGRTEQGEQPHLIARFRLWEAETRSFRTRTERNVLHSQMTLLFGDPTSRGSQATLDYCAIHHRPFLIIRWPGPIDLIPIRIALRRHMPPTLNIAGNRESVNPGVQAACRQLILQLFKEPI